MQQGQTEAASTWDTNIALIIWVNMEHQMVRFLGFFFLNKTMITAYLVSDCGSLKKTTVAHSQVIT